MTHPEPVPAALGSVTFIFHVPPDWASVRDGSKASNVGMSILKTILGGLIRIVYLPARSSVIIGTWKRVWASFELDAVVSWRQR